MSARGLIVVVVVIVALVYVLNRSADSFHGARRQRDSAAAAWLEPPVPHPPAHPAAWAKADSELAAQGRAERFCEALLDSEGYQMMNKHPDQTKDWRLDQRRLEQCRRPGWYGPRLDSTPRPR